MPVRPAAPKGTIKITLGFQVSNHGYYDHSNNAANGLDHHVIYPQQQPNSQGSSSMLTGSAAGSSSSSTKTSSKKSSPQFRWRRRKRRSKAQYPEMSRYLLPIDDGEEVQHLGRTLECTLCGLRGKRCHLTLHFKAKHNEVIDLAGVHTNRSKQTNSTKHKSLTTPQQRPQEQMCWQPPPPPQQSSMQIEQEQGQDINRAHLSAGLSEPVLTPTSSNVEDTTAVQGTSQRIVN